MTLYSRKDDSVLAINARYITLVVAEETGTDLWLLGEPELEQWFTVRESFAEVMMRLQGPVPETTKLYEHLFRVHHCNCRLLGEEH